MKNLGEKMLFISKMKQRGFTVCFSKNGNIVGKKSGFKSGEKEPINKPLKPQNLKSTFVFGLGRVWS